MLVEERTCNNNFKIMKSVVLFIINLLRNITNLAHPQNPGICMYVYDHSIKRFCIISINLKILESVHIYIYITRKISQEPIAITIKQKPKHKCQAAAILLYYTTQKLLP